MIDNIESERRRAFVVWMRTGRWPVARGADGREVKFNPWHDPRTGRFTFAGTGNFFAQRWDGGGFTGGGAAASAVAALAGIGDFRKSGNKMGARPGRERARRERLSPSPSTALRSCAMDMLTNSTPMRRCERFQARSTWRRNRAAHARRKPVPVAPTGGRPMMVG